MPDEITDKIIVSPKREAIIAAATELFLELGYGDVSMDTIAAKADVSKRTVYSHFENKEQLFEGIMCDVCACHSTHSEFFEDEKFVGLPVEEFLICFGQGFLEAMISPDSVSLYRAIVCQTERFPEIGRMFFEYGPTYETECLARYLTAQTEAGHLLVDDAVVAAQQLMSMLVMVKLMELSMGVRQSYSNEEIESQVKTTVGTFMKAFGA